MMIAALAHLPAASSVPGYAPEEITWWWMAVGLGLVVVLVVIGVLTLLIRLVQDIARGVDVLPGSSDPRPFGALMFEPPCLAGPFEPQGPSLLRPFSSRSGGKGE